MRVDHAQGACGGGAAQRRAQRLRRSAITVYYCIGAALLCDHPLQRLHRFVITLPVAAARPQRRRRSAHAAARLSAGHSGCTALRLLSIAAAPLCDHCLQRLPILSGGAAPAPVPPPHEARGPPTQRRRGSKAPAEMDLYNAPWQLLLAVFWPRMRPPASRLPAPDWRLPRPNWQLPPPNWQPHPSWQRLAFFRKLFSFVPAHSGPAISEGLAAAPRLRPYNIIAAAPLHRAASVPRMAAAPLLVSGGCAAHICA